METQLLMLFMQNVFATSLFCAAQQHSFLLDFQFIWSSYWLFMFLLHIACKSHSCIVYLGICFDSRTYWQLTLIGFILWGSSYVKVNSKWNDNNNIYNKNNNNDIITNNNLFTYQKKENTWVFLLFFSLAKNKGQT